MQGAKRVLDSGTTAREPAKSMMSARLLLNELAISSKIKEVLFMKEEKIFYLYFLNKMYRVLEDQEIIDSFIVLQ